MRRVRKSIRRRFATGLVMISAPCAHTLGLKARKRERVRCSSLVDWPVYPRLRGTMQASTRCRNKPMHAVFQRVPQLLSVMRKPGWAGAIYRFG
jgi:hypothetical protein